MVRLLAWGDVALTTQLKVKRDAVGDCAKVVEGKQVHVAGLVVQLLVVFDKTTSKSQLPVGKGAVELFVFELDADVWCFLPVVRPSPRPRARPMITSRTTSRINASRHSPPLALKKLRKRATTPSLCFFDRRTGCAAPSSGITQSGLYVGGAFSSLSRGGSPKCDDCALCRRPTAGEGGRSLGYNSLRDPRSKMVLRRLLAATEMRLGGAGRR